MLERLTRRLLFLWLPFATMACDRGPTEPLAEEPMIAGSITDIGTDVGSAGTLAMLVEEIPGKACSWRVDILEP